MNLKSELIEYSKNQIDEILKTLIVLIDTREQENWHIIDYLDTKKIEYEEMKLEHGDYSFYIPSNERLGIDGDIYFNDIVSVERKGSLEELSGNFCNGRNRIEEEFTRAKGKMYLMIENASYEDIVFHNYETNFKPVSFIATLNTFEARYGINTSFVKKKSAGNFIYHKFKYHLREYFKNGIL